MTLHYLVIFYLALLIIHKSLSKINVLTKIKVMYIVSHQSIEACKKGGNLLAFKHMSNYFFSLFKGISALLNSHTLDLREPDVMEELYM